MEVKEAVSLAIKYVGDLFASESLSNLGLEEVEFDGDSNEWTVTVGFSRPWDYPKGGLAVLGEGIRPERSFKLVVINDNSEMVIAIRNRSILE